MIEKLHELSEKKIYLVDVWGGKMWYNGNNGRYSWNINDFIKGYSNLNKFATCYGLYPTNNTTAGRDAKRAPFFVSSPSERERKPTTPTNTKRQATKPSRKASHETKQESRTKAGAADKTNKRRGQKKK